jgi:hypothetical protein
MEVKYKPAFIKDFNKIRKNKDKKAIYRICFEDVLHIDSISEIKNIKKIGPSKKFVGEVRPW